MKRILSAILVLLLLLPAISLAEIRRGDSGEDVREIQQLLFEMGFLFEVPDGKFGKNTEAAVRWFQETAELPVTGVITEKDSIRLYRSWLDTVYPGGGVPLPDDQLEPQPLSADAQGVLPLDNGDSYPACCTLWVEEGSGARITYCARHAAIAESAYWAYFSGIQPETPLCQQWEDAIDALYDEWMNLSGEAEQARVAAAQAAFDLFLQQQRAALADADADTSLEMVLRNQCAALCAIVHGLRTP